MPTQIMRLRGVPDDELEEVRGLLDDHDIDYYETPAGNWGMSMPGIWVRDPDEAARAKALLEAYQAQRAERARAEDSGRTFFDEVREHPVRFVVVLIGAAVVLYLSIMPFWQIGS